MAGTVERRCTRHGPSLRSGGERPSWRRAVGFAVLAALLAAGAAGCAPAAAVRDGKPIRHIEDYRSRVAQKVLENWEYRIPEDFRGTPTRTHLVLRIDRSGSLLTVQFYTRSNDPTLDESAVDAILRSEPFDPFPPDLASDDIEVGISFAAEPPGGAAP
jgi:outer membrane biosynthesis protein TonB